MVAVVKHNRAAAAMVGAAFFRLGHSGARRRRCLLAGDQAAHREVRTGLRGGRASPEAVRDNVRTETTVVEGQIMVTVGPGNNQEVSVLGARHGTERRTGGRRPAADDRQGTAGPLRLGLRRADARPQQGLADQAGCLAAAGPGRGRPLRARPEARRRAGLRRRPAHYPALLCGALEQARQQVEGQAARLEAESRYLEHDLKGRDGPRVSPNDSAS